MPLTLTADQEHRRRWEIVACPVHGPTPHKHPGLACPVLIPNSTGANACPETLRWTKVEPVPGSRDR